MQVRCQPARPRVLTLSGIGLAAIRRQGNAPKNASNLYQTDSFYRNFWEKTLGSRFGLDYGAASIAIVPAFDVKPPMLRVIGIASPSGAPSGTLAFTTNKPTVVGTSPENWMSVTGTLPIVTVGFTKLRASGLLGEGEPRPGRLVVSPKPVA